MKLEFETPEDLNLYRGNKYTFEDSTLSRESFRVYKAGKFYASLEGSIVKSALKITEEEKLHIRNEARLLGLL